MCCGPPCAHAGIARMLMPAPNPGLDSASHAPGRVQIRAPFEDVSNIEDSLEHPFPNVSKPLIVLYQVLICIVILNLLIALMTTTYNKIAQSAYLEWYWQFAGLVLSAEVLTLTLASHQTLHASLSSLPRYVCAGSLLQL